MAAPVMSNDSIPLPEEVEQLGVRVIGAQWPAMMEGDGLRVLGAPVLVEYRHPILRGNRAHLKPPKLWRTSADVRHPRSTSKASAALRSTPPVAGRRVRPGCSGPLDRRASKHRPSARSSWGACPHAS